MKKFFFIMAMIMIVPMVIIGAFTMNAKPVQTNVEHVKSKPQVTKPKAEKNIPSLLIVVNKKHPLPRDYNPYLGDTNGNNADGTGLLPEANNTKNRLIIAMQQAGFPISNQVSSYRSEAYQKQLYDSYVAKEGKEKADTYSARPGYSDHQTGLAFDLLETKGDLPTDDKMYKWLGDNAYKFGFIIRFPRGETEHTGYMGEEWHLRYIGIENATQMHNKNIKTLEDFTHVSGGNYNQYSQKDVLALNETK